MHKYLSKVLLIPIILFGLSSKGHAMKSLWRLLSSEEPQKKDVRVLKVEEAEDEKKPEPVVQLTTLDQSQINDHYENYDLRGFTVFPNYPQDHLPGFSYDMLTRVTVIESDEGSIDLVEYLSQNCKNLRYLNLTSCHRLTVFGTRGSLDKSVMWLLSYPAEFPNLQELVVNDCPHLTTLKVTAPLQYLSVQRDPQLQTLGVISEDLVYISMDGSTALTDGVLDGLTETCPRLERMSCQGCAQLKKVMIREQLPMLSKKTQHLLETKNAISIAKQRTKREPIDCRISYSDMDNRMSREIARIPLLTRLILYKVQIGDTDIRVFLMHPSLQYLYVMSDLLVSIVGNYSYMESFYKEAIPIQTSLKELWLVKCPNLTEIRLKGNTLSALEAPDNPNLKSLVVESGSLEKLNIRRSGVSNELFQELIMVNRELKTVCVDGCPNIPELPSKFLNGSGEVKQRPADQLFNLGSHESHSSILTSKKAGAFNSMSITSLGLNFYEIRGNSLPVLDKITNLRLLGCTFPIDVLLDIRRMKTLRLLTLSDTPIGPQGAKDLVESKNLEALILTNTEVKDEGAQFIIEAIYGNRKPFVSLDDATVSPDKLNRIKNLNALNNQAK